MIFTTTSLFAAGLAATSIPIVIHLLSKGKPKKIVFPALRFTQAIYAANRRKFTLRKLLLLAVRVAFVVVLGAALARPFFGPSAPANQGDGQNANAAQTGRDRPVETIIVVDSAPGMARVSNNETLLETARKAARDVVDHAPQGSEFAVLDGSEETDAFQPDRFAAKEALDKLATVPNGRPVSQTALAAFELARKNPGVPSEIFIFTDGARRSWSERDVARLSRAYASLNENPPTLFLVDLGEAPFRNSAVANIALSSQTPVRGSSLRIDAEISREADAPGDIAVEMLLFETRAFPDEISHETMLQNAARAVRRDAQTLSFPEGKSKRTAVFHASGLPTGSCVGLVRIQGGDALAVDDVRSFAFEVEQEEKLLVVANEPLEETALFFTQAIAPEEQVRAGTAPFAIDVAPYDSEENAKSQKNGVNSLAGASDQALASYRAVFLLDPPALAPETVARLTSFVSRGGGLGVFLGPALNDPASFQTQEAVRLLGGKITKQVGGTRGSFEISPLGYDSPLLAPFRSYSGGSIPWDAMPVAKYWQMTELADSASVAAVMTRLGASVNAGDESDPAILENVLGAGLVAVMTTPISDAFSAAPWNSLGTGECAWLYLVLADGIVSRLAFGTDSNFNCETGEAITLRSPASRFPSVAAVTKPDGQTFTAPADPERRQIRLPGSSEPGIYRVRSRGGADGDALDLAYSVAIPASDSDLTRWSEEDWNRLSEGLPHRALDLRSAPGELDRARRSRETEPYALLAALLALLFVAETRLSNRFYAS